MREITRFRLAAIAGTFSLATAVACGGPAVVTTATPVVIAPPPPTAS